MPRVDKVLCFGLEALAFEQYSQEDHLMRCYLQHWTAWWVGEVLREVQGSEGIELVAQDPAYCGHCREKLWQDLRMKVVDTPERYLEVTGNSFVVTKAPSAPVRQVVADFTAEERGPAGMLCDIIKETVGLTPLADGGTARLVAYKAQNRELEKGARRSWHQLQA